MSAWAGFSAAPDWVQLDLGAEVAVDRIVLLPPALPPGTIDGILGQGTDAAFAEISLRLLSSVTVVAAPASAPMAGASPGTMPLTLDGMAVPVYSLYARPGWEFEDRIAAGFMQWTGLSHACGYDPVPSTTSSLTPTSAMTSTSSQSGSPTQTATPSTTLTASVTSSHTPTPSHTPSHTPSPSSTASPSSSGTTTPSATASASLSSSPSVSPVPLPPLPTGPSYAWRSDASLVSLEAAGISEPFVSSDASSLSLTWAPFADSGSGVAAVSVCFGTRPLACDIVPEVTRAPRTGLDSVNVSVNPALTPGTTVYGTVSASNNVGFVTRLSSPGVTHDARAPSIDAVLDTGPYFLYPETGALPGAGAIALVAPRDIDCDVQGNGVGASWRDVLTFSGVSGYEWAVGTSGTPPGTTADLMPWTSVGTDVAAYNPSLFVPAGTIYYACVRTTSSAGVAAIVCSDGVLVLTGGAGRDLCVFDENADSSSRLNWGSATMWMPQ